MTIPLTVSDGGTTSTDYAGVPASLVFARGTTERGFIVRATDDRVDDDGEGVTLGFGALPQGVTAGSPATAEVSIDDDDARRVTVEPVVLSIDEGGSAGYTVVLDTEPERERERRRQRARGHRSDAVGGPPALHLRELEHGAEGDGERSAGRRRGGRRGDPEPHGDRRRLHGPGGRCGGGDGGGRRSGVDGGDADGGAGGGGRGRRGARGDGDGGARRGGRGPRTRW